MAASDSRAGRGPLNPNCPESDVRPAQCAGFLRSKPCVRDQREKRGIEEPIVCKQVRAHRFDVLRNQRPDVPFILKIGRDVADKILKYALAKEIDVIVLASHGRTGLARIWLGSVAEKVVRSAQCPVLVLRSPAVTTARTASG